SVPGGLRVDPDDLHPSEPRPLADPAIAAIRSGTDPVGELPDAAFAPQRAKTARRGPRSFSSLAGDSAGLPEVRCELQPGGGLGTRDQPMVRGGIARTDPDAEEGHPDGAWIGAPGDAF